MARGGGRAGWRGLVVGAVLLGSGAQARQLAGVSLPESLRLQGREVHLAHMELHEKLWLDVYVWALYLEHPPRKTSEAIASNGAKRLQFRFLRNVSREQLVDAFRGGLAGHSALEAPGMRSALERLLATLRGVSRGDELILTYLPGVGLHISGKASGGLLIPGKRFADALFTVWLESHPIFPK